MEKRNPTYSLEQLKERVHYDPETGIFTRRKTGKLFPSSGPLGYIRFSLMGSYVYAHRLAWFYVHGTWPVKEIDHINQDKKDNRISNLRDVTRSVNQLNRPVWGKVKLRGVRLSREGNRYTAQIMHKGKCLHLGSYKSPYHAHSAYRIAASALC